MSEHEIELVTILIPVYKDQESLSLLLPQLDVALGEGRGRECRWQVLLVNDGAIEPPLPLGWRYDFRHIQKIDVLSLRRNLGHQRAIAIGLAELSEHSQAGAVVVMDGDGEDNPKDVVRLLSQMLDAATPQVVFAARMRRSEGVVFSVGYHVYRVVHWLLTGIAVRFGNFSIIPRAHLDRLVCADELWNHYAASVVKLRLPFGLLPTSRASRLAGRSRMNGTALVVHGLSAMSVYAELIGVRLLLATATVGGLLAAVIAAVAAARVTSFVSFPQWATYAVGLLLLMLGQLFAVSLMFVFVILGGRTSMRFLPVRDYAHFIYEKVKVFEKDGLSSV